MCSDSGSRSALSMYWPSQICCTIFVGSGGEEAFTTTGIWLGVRVGCTVGEVREPMFITVVRAMGVR